MDNTSALHQSEVGGAGAPSARAAGAGAAGGGAPAAAAGGGGADGGCFFSHTPEERAALLSRLPPEVPDEADPAVVSRFLSYAALTAGGRDFTASLRDKPDFANPYLLDRVIESFGIPQGASNYPTECERGTGRAGGRGRGGAGGAGTDAGGLGGRAAPAPRPPTRC
jgi:hypothetical protein